MRLLAPLSLLYFVVLAIDIYAEMIEDIEMVWFTKPLLMPILLVLFLMNAKSNAPKERLFFALALFFSLAGDVFLMFKNDDLFIFGLGSFLIGHLAYIISFAGRIKEAQVSIGGKVLSAIPFVIFVAVFLWFLYPNIMGDPETAPIFAPVVVYACIIATMGFTSLLRRKAVSDFGFWMVFGGALLFILSDSCIAINKFVSPLEQPGLIIMSTYGMAQFLLTIGTLKSDRV